jgi:peptidoglycan/LPS O-acetylase OafA/YrhL
MNEELLHPKYRRDVDGLRALAVLLVIAYHYFPGHLTGGFVGVDIFFVISGYLISSIVFSNLERGIFSYEQFYGRRIRRIFPALIIVLLGSLAFGWFVLLKDEFRQIGKHVAAGAAFGSNLVLWSESGYFDADASLKPLLHLWSLGIEEQFYIFWPLMLGLAWRYRSNLLAITVSVALLSFVVNLLTVSNDPTAAYYSPLTRSWELMIGGILAYISSRPTTTTYRLLKRSPNLQSLVGMILVGIGAVCLDPHSVFPGWWALLPTIGAFLLISAGPAAWLNRVLLGNGLVVRVGLISYPLYLWHWPLYSYALICLDGSISVPLKISLIAATFVLAQLTYAIVERRVRFAHGALAIPVLGGLMVGTLVLGIAASSALISPRNSDASLEKLVQAVSDWEFPDGWESYRFSGVKFFAQAAQRNTTVFIGDSNVEQYAPRIRYVINHDPASAQTAIMATEGGCSVIPLVFVHQQRICTEKMNAAIQLAHQSDVTKIVLGQNWLGYRSELNRSDVQDSLASLIRGFGANRKVYLLLNMPVGPELNPRTMFGGSRFSGLYRRSPAELNFNYSAFEASYADVRKTLTRIAAANGAIVIDPLSVLCPSETCPIADSDGRPFYKDHAHLTATYARAKAAFIDTTISVDPFVSEPR